MQQPGPGRPLGLAKTGGRQKGTPNKSTPEKKEQTRAFFRRILDDEIEAKFWRYFMTGYEVVTLPEGGQQIIPIPLDPVAWSCFRRAVEYKRGMPVQLIQHENSDELPFKIEVTFCQPQQ
jgi:hypothetical protein